MPIAQHEMTTNRLSLPKTSSAAKELDPMRSWRDGGAWESAEIVGRRWRERQRWLKGTNGSECLEA
jgi:hypothetical protein